MGPHSRGSGVAGPWQRCAQTVALQGREITDGLRVLGCALFLALPDISLGAPAGSCSRTGAPEQGNGWFSGPRDAEMLPLGVPGLAVPRWDRKRLTQTALLPGSCAFEIVGFSSTRINLVL